MPRIALRWVFAATLLAISSRSFATDLAAGPGCCVRVTQAPQRDELVRRGALFLESEHFIVAYFTSGPDSMYHPELMPTLLEDLEHAHRVLSTDPRCAMRAPYGTFAAADGRRKIEVSVEDIGLYGGFAHPDWPSQAPDAPCEFSADGTITITRRALERNRLRQVGTHELMHVFQFVMNAGAGSWAFESTARWAEGFVHPEDRIVQRSRPSLLYHTTPIWDDWNRSKLYSPHYWNFLDQILTASIPPKVWAHACDHDWIAALRIVLADYSITLDHSLHQFAVWNYYTGRRDDGAHYGLPELSEIRPEERLMNYPVAAHDLGDKRADEAASNYLFFMGEASRENLRVRLHGSPGWLANRMVSWIGTTGLNTHHEVDVDPASDEFVVPQWHQYDQVAVIVTNGVFEVPIPLEELRYTIAAWEEGNSVADLAWGTSRGLLKSTNPAIYGAAIRFRSTGVARATHLAVYDARGRLVRSLMDRTLPAGSYGVYWDGTSHSGDPAAAGAYVLRLRHDSGTVTRRVILLR